MLRSIVPPKCVFDAYRERGEAVADAGTNTMTFSTVPDGQVWIVEQASATNINTANTTSFIRVVSGANEYSIAGRFQVAGRDQADLKSYVTLFPGENLRMVFYNANAGDQLRGWAVGIKLSIDLF